MKIVPNFFNSGLFHHAKEPLEEILKTKLKGPLTVITLNDFCAILLDDILVTQLWEADTSADAQMSTLRSDQNYHQTCWQASPAREPEGKQEMGKSNIFQKLQQTPHETEQRRKNGLTATNQLESSTIHQE